MPGFPDFDAFYRAVNGRDPFPWQQRLADQVRASGWPSGIGVATGLGKTACLDIAVWAMAAERDLPAAQRGAPTRVWYVVNRRLLVDTAFEHGQHLAQVLRAPTGGPDGAARKVIGAVADGLRARQGGAAVDPLHVCRLRGAAELGARPPDPAQPSLVFATVPMFASRWLFRGFGTSASMRPVDAALAGVDSLVLLDEAHLARPLADLAEPVAQCDVGDPAAVVPASRARPVIVRMSATGDPDAFTLDDADEVHPVVRKRLGACKPVALVTAPKGRLVGSLADEATRLLSGRRPSAAVVFCNAPGTARAVFEGLAAARGHRTQPLDAELVLLTGRMREREAAAVRRLVLDVTAGAPAGRPRPPGRDNHLVVVATQTLEVGADLDFDVLVTEVCGARALVQRLGRLNRLGDAEDAAGAVVFPEGETQFGIYGEEPSAVWERLLGRAVDGVIDLSPRVAAEVVGMPGDLPGRVGELLPAHVWEWAKTTTPPPGEAPPELFYQGFDTDSARVSVVWHVAIPAAGAELRPAVVADEAIEIPIWEARDALADLEDGTVSRLRPDRVTVEHQVPLGQLRPGDVVILPAGAGRCDRYGWAPGARGPVLDVSLLRPPGLPLLPEALAQFFTGGEALDDARQVARVLAEPPEPDEDLDRRALAARLVGHLRRTGPGDLVCGDELDALQARLTPNVVYFPDEMAGRLQLQPEAGRTPPVELQADVFDELSCAATSANLADHLDSVGKLAGQIADRLGLPQVLIDAVAAAGRFHDLGKADDRFQRWLNPEGATGQPVAKSATARQHWERDRIRSGWPAGGRHEELSRRLVAAYLADNHDPPWDGDLVLHLVVSHHGYGRPLVLGVPDSLGATVAANVDGSPAKAPGDLLVVDWDQPARFRRCCERYGYWGLALLEAIVRQADHQVSKVVVA